MNFFGHAALACYRLDASGFVLGAMLPDFASMIRARPPLAEHAQITAGIAYHHLTDHVFHDAPAFRGLCSEAFATLEARGVRRGSARAVAHVGVEILLDGVLARDPRAREAYRKALQRSTDSELGQYLKWHNDAEKAHFEKLRAILEQRGIAADDVEPELVTLRLSRALAGRPRLSLDEAAEKTVRQWASEARSAVADRADELLAQVRFGLSTADISSPAGFGGG